MWAGVGGWVLLTHPRSQSPDEANTRSNRSTGRLCVDSGGRRDCFVLRACIVLYVYVILRIRMRNLLRQFTCPIVRPINSSKLNKTFGIVVEEAAAPAGAAGADLHGRHL